MTILYSCRHDGDLYRISKFNDGNVESSYLTDGSACDCPAGQRRVCRHREMLPLFIRRGAVNSGWQLDYDRGGWVQMYADEVEHTTPAELTIATMIELPADSTAEQVAEAFAGLSSEASTTPAEPLLPGTNLTASQVSPQLAMELEYRASPPPAKSWRRF